MYQEYTVMSSLNHYLNHLSNKIIFLFHGNCKFDSNCDCKKIENGRRIAKNGRKLSQSPKLIDLVLQQVDIFELKTPLRIQLLHLVFLKNEDSFFPPI